MQGYDSDPLCGRLKRLAIELKLLQRLKNMRSSAKDYWKDSEPQLKELYERPEHQGNARMEPYLRYPRGRLALLAMRAKSSGESAVVNGLDLIPGAEIITGISMGRRVS